MSFGEGNLRERVAELERENARLLASLLAATESAHADFPALALDWDDAGEVRKREWCQWLYEHAAKQDGRIVALEARNAALESLVRDMWLTWKRLDEAHEWPDPEDGVHNGHNGWKAFVDCMSDLGIEVGA